MPNYAEPFAAAGGAAGGAAGAGLGGFLGRVGDLLDSPRQALWNLVRSGYNAASGQGTWDDALRAVPGALGAGVGAALTATGVGAPLGVLAGSALGGLGQAVAKSSDEEKFSAPTAEDVTGSDNPLLNMLVGAAGDPLTYAGGIGGASKGAQAGRTFGRGLEEAAAWRGPQYPGGLDTLNKAMAGVNPKDAGTLTELLENLRGNPQALSELAPGSTYLGNGVQTVAFKTPEGGVTSLMSPYLLGDAIPGARADIPEMLQATRSKPYAGDFPVRVEHTPLLSVKQRLPGESLNSMIDRIEEGQVIPMMDRMTMRGVEFSDPHMGNVGQTPGGRWMILDPGAVSPNYIGTETPLPLAPELAQREPSALQSVLLKLLGSDKSVRNEINAGNKVYRGGTSLTPNTSGMDIADIPAGFFGQRPTPSPLSPHDVSPGQSAMLDALARGQNSALDRILRAQGVIS